LARGQPSTDPRRGRRGSAAGAEGIGRVLEEAALEVVGVAGDAKDLVRKAGPLHPDVVVTDIQMPPDLTDGELARRAADRSTLPDVGVVVLSQFPEDCCFVAATRPLQPAPGDAPCGDLVGGLACAGHDFDRSHADGDRPAAAAPQVRRPGRRRHQGRRRGRERRYPAMVVPAGMSGFPT
jgi:CheY-like chemotaxis protein